MDIRGEDGAQRLPELVEWTHSPSHFAQLFSAGLLHLCYAMASVETSQKHNGGSKLQ